MSRFLAVFFVLLCVGCSHGSDDDSSAGQARVSAPEPQLISGPNTMIVKVSDPTMCSSNYANELCTTVTICAPGTSSCQTIPNILVDTGSYGLRIFSSIVNLALPSVTADGTASGTPVGECAQFGSGNDWGSVVTADVVLGGEEPVTIPIQLIDKSYAGGPPSGTCANPDSDPASVGFNGILGIGLFAQDCGTNCESDPSGYYYACSGNSCTATTMQVANQVTNPIYAQSQDNNGLMVVLEPVPVSGYTSLTGQIVLGIGTRDNNIPSNSLRSYRADSTAGYFSTSFNGTSYARSFLDTGSNGIFFAPNGATPLCGSATGFFCPSGTLSYSATVQGMGDGHVGTVNFSVGNAETMFGTGNMAFSGLAGEWDSAFDWGLPFFYGRTVFIGFEGRSSNRFGSGPYWAF